MSRGLGKIERMCLEVLQQKKRMESIEIAATALGKNGISPSEHVSFRRALNNLVKKKLIAKLGRHWEGGRCFWALPENARAYCHRIQQQFGKNDPMLREYRTQWWYLE